MFSERLKEARISAGYKFAKDFAKVIGIPYNTYSGYERGDREPDIQTIIKFSQQCKVSTDFLLGLQDYPTPEREIPILGSIHVSLPVLDKENYSETISVCQSQRNANFALRVTDDSMAYAGVHEGDIVLMRQAEKAESGQIVAVVARDMDCMATLRFYVGGKAPALRAANPKYQDQPFAPNHRIIGVFAGLVRAQGPDMREYQGLIAGMENMDDDWNKAKAEFASLGWGPEEVRNFVNMVRMAKK